ncbi:MAG TPA: Uma2 family endonuclease [Streptosporangiaceae bacterium]
MAHSLLHQILVSDLVVPIALAQTPDQRILPRFGVRLAAGTWLRGDVVVVDRARLPADGWFVDGPPLLVAEVTSDASARADLGPKKEMWARSGVPSLWIVQPGVRRVRLHVYELDGEEYVERARLSGDRPYRVKQPFEMDLVPDEIFGRTINRPAAGKGPATKGDRPARRGSAMTERSGPDLPAATEKILVDAFGHRWPTGAEKAELWDGCPVFYGVWDERDVEIAQRAYPGRVIRLDQESGEPGTLSVLPAGLRSAAETAE